MVWEFWCFEYIVTMSGKGVYRTALVTPGLLQIYDPIYFLHDRSYLFNQYCDSF